MTRITSESNLTHLGVKVLRFVDFLTKNTMDKNPRDRVVTPFGWTRFYFAAFASKTIWTLQAP
jgi:hypothetical protein